MQDEVPDEESSRHSMSALPSLSALSYDLHLSPAIMLLRSKNPSGKSRTASQAILQVMKDNDRALTVLAIELMAGRLLGRPLSRQSIRRYLAGLIRSNTVERAAKDLYRLTDHVKRKLKSATGRSSVGGGQAPRDYRRRPAVILGISHGTPRREHESCPLVRYSLGDPNSCCQLFGSLTGANDK
jgi:hypothetical protein